MTNIRDRVSDILGIRIQGESWEKYVDKLNPTGRPDRITLIRMVMAMGQAIEDLQKEVEYQRGRLNEYDSPGYLKRAVDSVLLYQKEKEDARLAQEKKDGTPDKKLKSSDSVQSAKK